VTEILARRERPEENRAAATRVTAGSAISRQSAFGRRNDGSRTSSSVFLPAGNSPDGSRSRAVRRADVDRRQLAPTFGESSSSGAAARSSCTTGRNTPRRQTESNRSSASGSRTSHTLARIPNLVTRTRPSQHGGQTGLVELDGLRRLPARGRTVRRSAGLTFRS